MVLGFKKQFVSKILDGTKIHTIREDPHNRWQPGRKIHMATGVRTSYYDQFNEAKCIRVQEFEIKWIEISAPAMTYTMPSVYVDGLPFSLERIAVNDGFNSLADFLKWFNKDFKGKIIHWTECRY